LKVTARSEGKKKNSSTGTLQIKGAKALRLKDDFRIENTAKKERSREVLS